MTTSAGVAQFQPTGRLAARTELTEEDALFLADCALKREKGWDRIIFGINFFGLVASVFLKIPLGIEAFWWNGIFLFAIILIRLYKDTIMVKAMDLDRKLRKQAFKVARERASKWDVIFARRKRARQLIADEVFAQFGSKPLEDEHTGPSSDEPRERSTR